MGSVILEAGSERMTVASVCVGTLPRVSALSLTLQAIGWSQDDSPMQEYFSNSC